MITDKKESTEFFSIESETPADFKAKFNEMYVRKDKAYDDPDVRAKIGGSILGSEMTNFYRTFKENGVEFDTEEKAALKKNEDLMASGIKKLIGPYVNKVAELEAKVGQGGDERLKTMEEEKLKLVKKANELKAAWENTSSELEKERANSQSVLKSYKIGTMLSKAREPLKMKQKLTEAERLGFEAAISQKLKFDLSDKEELETFNLKGERIVSKQKAGDFLNATEALQDLVNELGLAEINPRGGQAAPNGGFLTSRTTQTELPPATKRVLFRGKPLN